MYRWCFPSSKARDPPELLIISPVLHRTDCGRSCRQADKRPSAPGGGGVRWGTGPTSPLQWAGVAFRRLLGLTEPESGGARQQVLPSDCRLRKFPWFLELSSLPRWSSSSGPGSPPPGCIWGPAKALLKCSPRKGQTCSSGSGAARHHPLIRCVEIKRGGDEPLGRVEMSARHPEISSGRGTQGWERLPRKQTVSEEPRKFLLWVLGASSSRQAPPARRAVGERQQPTPPPRARRQTTCGFRKPSRSPSRPPRPRPPLRRAAAPLRARPPPTPPRRHLLLPYPGAPARGAGVNQCLCPQSTGHFRGPQQLDRKGGQARKSFPPPAGSPSRGGVGCGGGSGPKGTEVSVWLPNSPPGA